MNFPKQFISNPKNTGAVASSSKQLTKLIVDSADIPSEKCVVELGCIYKRDP
ncbi:MAG TPA: hypothetical protein QF873_00320 [Patescibacteria group bacterium]|nr:hypothetical protein [Patescibacteria group bacterium]